MGKLICLSVSIVFYLSNVSATIINVPADYDTIQVAINASSDGDTVLVADGHYYERINFYGKGILLTSEFMLDGDTLHIQNTIIDADTLVLGVADTGSVVCFVNGEDSTSIIQGFSLQNGIGIIMYNNRYGGGIYCSVSSPTISNNTISGNSSNSFGGGICCYYNSSPTISNNTITGNSAGYGGGISCWESSPAISNNTISGNSSNSFGGGIYCLQSSPTISNNTITGNSANYGGGIYCFQSSPTISNNTISGNSADHGGGIGCSRSDLVVVNTILWANIADEIFLDNESSISITYSDIQSGWEGEGNIDADPLFCLSDTAYYWLSEISPCVGAGQNGEDIGAYGIGCEEPQSDIPDDDSVLPFSLTLSQNYPNPFNPTTTITFSLPKLQLVTLNIYDLLGREVQTLVDEQRQAGLHTVMFDASHLSSGIYFYRLQAGDYSESKRMVLLK